MECNIYAVRRFVKGDTEVVQYEAVIVDCRNFEIVSRQLLPEKIKLKALQCIPNYESNTALVTLNSKQLVIQNMSDLTLLTVITFANLGGSLSPPFCTDGIGFIIP